MQTKSYFSAVKRYKSQYKILIEEFNSKSNKNKYLSYKSSFCIMIKKNLSKSDTAKDLVL